MFLRKLTYFSLIALAFAACSGKDGGGSVVPPEPDAGSVLMVRAGILESGRSAVQIPDCEKINTLRTIVTDADGRVEHNDFIDYGLHPQTSCYRIFEVKPGVKHMYFIANEKGAGSALQRVLEPFDAAALAAYTFTQTDGPIPATAVCDAEVTAADAGRRIEMETSLVRAATKVSFRFKNYRRSDVEVNSIDISSIAASMYLMPRVKEPDLYKDFGSERLHWTEWLRRVSDESQKNLEYPSDYDPALARSRGWIMAYDVPAGVAHSKATITMSGLKVPREMTESQRPVVTDEYYYNESKYNTPAAAPDGVQSYTMTFHLTEHLVDDPGKTRQITQTLPFPNLDALFRNTHVLVDVEFNSEIIVRVIPYAECKLDPIFGLDPKKPSL